MKNEIKKENEVAVNRPAAVAAPAVQSSGILIGVVIGVLLCSTTVLGYTMISKARKAEEKPVVVPTEAPTSVPMTSPTVEKITPTPYGYMTPTPLPMEKRDFGVVSWLQFPKVLAKMDIFNQKSTSDGWVLETTKFHQVGNFADGSKLINLYLEYDGMGIQNNLFRLIVSSLNETYVLNVGDEWLRSPFDNQKVKFISSKIDGLEVPEKLETSKGRLVNYSPFGSGVISFTELKHPVFYEKSNYGDIYIVYSETEVGELKGKAKDKLFYLRLKDDTVASYEMRPSFVSDDNVPKINWTDGTVNKEQFVSGILRGCGTRSGKIIDTGLVVNRVQVGTAGGDPIYQVTDINNLVIKKLNDEAFFGGEKKLSPEELIKAKNHFFWQDGMGDWIVFVNTKFEMPAECGKPVIYLYPEKEMAVNVQVGAEIRKSEPEYPEKGWTVLAKPNGELIYEGQKYPYLFWEGLGKGIYPDYRNRGTVVSQDRLVETVKSQLKELGLNSKETADFMEFWQERLPKTPYVRLTWLMTEDMDKLAPLMVRPRPENYIRVFLEFEGLDKPIKLMPQKLVAAERKGFTLVEWGGLLVKER